MTSDGSVSYSKGSSRRRRWAGGVFLLWLLGAMVTMPAAAVSAAVTPPAKDLTVTLGDPVQLSVVLTYPKDHQPPTLLRRFPAEIALLDEEIGPPTRQNGDVTEERRLRLALFQTGDVTIGPLRYSTVAPDGELLEFDTAPLTIHVTSVLTEENPEPSPPAPPWIIPYPLEKLVLLLAVLAGLIAAAFGTIWYLRKRRRLREGILPPGPPHLEARQRLYALAARDLPAQGQIKPFYFLASEIIKDYLGKELDVRVLERTTAEIVGQLPAVKGMTDDTNRQVREFLLKADLVKFAGHIPSPAEIDRWQRMAYDLIQHVHGAVDDYRRTMQSVATVPPAEVAS